MARIAKKKAKSAAPLKGRPSGPVPAKSGSRSLPASRVKAAAPKKAAPKKAAPKKAAPKKAAPKKAAPKKAAPKKAAPKKAALARKPARDVKASPPPLRDQGGRARHTNRRSDGAAAFLPDPTAIGHKRVRDDLAEELGEEFVAAVTSGEAVDDARDEPAPEEDGGPFVTTTASSQYGQGTDESNPEDAEREPFPTTRSERR